MKRADSIRSLLNRHLQHHGEPPAHDVAAAVDHVWKRLAPDAMHTPGERVLSVPQRSWQTPLAAAVAAALVLAAAIGTAILWRSNDDAPDRIVEQTVERGEAFAQLQQPEPQPPAQTVSPSTTPRAQFEEASVRLCPEDPPDFGGRGGGANSLFLTPGRLYAQCLTLATLIRTAYGYGPMQLEFMNATETPDRPRGPGMRLDQVYGLGVEDGQRVRGGPDWVRSEKYSIEATADATADAETMRGPMLQDLLERRFQLRVRPQTEQVPGFALTVAPGGLKIKPMQPGDCSRDPLPDPVRAERERKGWGGPVLVTEAAYFKIKPTCGFIYGERNGPNFRIEAANSPGRVPIGGALAARVVDRTGITDNYLFVFEYGPDETTPGINRMMFAERDWIPKPGFDAPATHPKAPPLASALEEQLGLKLERIQVSRAFIVIDRVERPAPN